MTRALLIAMLLAACGAAGAQSIHRWVDAQGRVHYTSDPPTGTRTEPVRPRVNSYAAPAAATSPAPAPQPKAAAAGPVVMYSTSWCTYCEQARTYFGRNGIAYTEHDIEKSATANAEFKRLGGRGVPLILVGREKMAGFSELGFESLLVRAERAR
ncbi:MAG: glutaredoxin family protein [Betaproteobacteria bacterium]|nr:glutaredoxin family protein [Betaproteobacteria bacterium]MDH5220583.1 glutaredoxin family protein [Betaproteobacteria bacterium]MDH5352468.1 glutaredoxin family protein [Betaproteobacteria bacterium]